MADFRNIPKDTEPDGYWHCGNIRQILADDPEGAYVAPFRLAPHVWMVSGQPDNGSYLIDTGDGGLILVDAPYQCAYEHQLRAIREAGFDPKDIKNIFLSHAHFDHYGAMDEFVRLTGAPVWLTHAGKDWWDERKAAGLERKSDSKYGDSFPISMFYDDHNPVTIGRFTFRFESHDGHCPGAVVMFFEDTDEATGQTYTVGMHGGIGTCNSQWIIREGAKPWHYYRYISDNLEMAEKYTVDITLPNHENQTNMHSGINEADRSDYSAFVNRDVWKNLMIQKAELAIQEG